jgi:signal peptidase II
MRVRKVFMFLLFPAGLVIVLDQLTKLLVTHALRPYESVMVIPGFFELVHVRNRGIAFGLMNHLGAAWSSIVLSGVTAVAIVLLIFWLARLRENERWMAFGLSLIIGGAVGNLIDRIRLGEVVDFLDFYVGALHWPAFNIADSAVTLGTFWVALSMLLHHRE